jgi:PAS domain S-box-containing protein
MTTISHAEETHEQLCQRIQQLVMRLEEAESTLQAIRQGEVDALVVSSPDGPRVYTLQSADHPYRILVQEMQEGALTLTSTGLILYANLAFARMMRTSLEHIIGTAVQRFVVPHDLQRFMALLEYGAHGDSRGEVRLQAADGTLVTTFLACNSLWVDDFQSMCLVVTDLTEQKRLEGEAQRTQHFTMLGRLAAGVSHEIRNPLAALFLYVDLLKEELQQPTPESPTQIAEALTEISTQLMRIDDLVQDYLSLVRVTNVQQQPQDLGSLVQAWATEMQAPAATQGITLQLEGIESLGQVAFHASTLRRVLLNLVQNALDATPNGGTVSIVGQDAETHIQLQVRDTGSGIPAERLEHIFEPLYTTKSGGTGLGLYIVQEIVAAHGGQITVQTTEGQGTTFSITLPRVPAAAPTPAELA